MCRAGLEGGRRCPGCNNAAAREAHNIRRRLNRAIKAEAIKRAEQRTDFPASALQKLKDLPPGQAKRFAIEHNLHQDQSDDAGAGNDPKSLTSGQFAQAVEMIKRKKLERQEQAQGKQNPPARERKKIVSIPPTPELKSDDALAKAPWAVRPGIEGIRALQGNHPAEADLLSGEVITTESVAAGINETERFLFKDGSTGYFKGFDSLADRTARSFGQEGPLQPLHEAAAWQLAKALGPKFEPLVPPCVITSHNGQLGSLARGVAGQPAGYRGHRMISAETFRRAAFFDSLIGQQDRHGYNYLVDGDQVHLIDHGFTFAVSGNPINASKFASDRYSSKKDRKLVPEETAALTRLLKSEDLQGMARIIAPERAKALRRRAKSMLKSGEILSPGQY